MLRRLSSPIILATVLLAIGIYAQQYTDTITQRIVIELFINLLLVIALQMFMGNSGVVSFAHIGFMGIGAYASIILTLPELMKTRALRSLYPFLEGLSADFIPALIIGGLVAAAVAAVLGFPLMRLSGSASVIATFALLVIIHVVLKNWTQVTNGPRSVFGVPKLTTINTAMLWAILLVFIAYIFKESNLGLRLRASREDELAARSIGINIVLNRWLAFIISAFFTGVAGGLHAHFLGQFGPDEFYLTKTFLILSMLIIGGTTTVSGATVGVILVTILSESMRDLEAEINLANTFSRQISGAAPVVVSVLTILVLILRPAGLIGGRELEWPFFKRQPPQEEAEPINAN